MVGWAARSAAGRAARAAGLVALTVSVVAALLGQNGTASAAAGAPTAANAAAPVAASPRTPKAPATAGAQDGPRQPRALTRTAHAAVHASSGADLPADAPCTSVTDADTSLGSPASLGGTLVDTSGGAAGDCYDLPTAAGEVLRVHLSDWRVDATVYDAGGVQVCSTRPAQNADLDCTLTGAAPFRVTTGQEYAPSIDYTVTFARLSHPAGCPTVAPQDYGTVPDGTSATRCRLLHVTAAGPYLFGPAAAGGGSVQGSLYAAGGGAVCTPILLQPCALTPGDYTWARDGRDTATAPYAVWFHATAATAGCTAGRDDDFASGPATGTFTGAGQQLCLTLPTATGNGLYLLDQPPADAVSVDVHVFDAKGVQQCDDSNVFAVCKLTGTGPFHAVLQGPATGGTYRLGVQRTADTSGCTAWPQSAFGGSWGVQTSLTEDRQTVCLGIGANQHSTAEMFDYTNDLNRVNASVQVYDKAGDQVCSTVGSSTTTCRFTAGTAYSALLIGTGWTDTYKLVRRDISATARCAAPASLTVGGPSTGFTLDSALASGCLRVSAAAGDRMWFSARTPTAAYETGALLGVVDASGTIVCRQYGVSCRATGSTSYVIFVLAEGYAGTAISAHVDTWRIGTSAGWASQCTSHVVSPDGFAVRGGTLTESSTAYCAVLQMKPSQRFQVFGAHHSTTGTPWVSLLSTTRFAGSSIDNEYQCFGDNVGEFSFSCLTTGSAPAGQYVMVLSAGDASTPDAYQMQGVCLQGCTTARKQADIASLSPATGPAEASDLVVLHGTNLTLGTKVTLAANGSPASSYTMSQPVSINADGTVLTVRLFTYGVTPGVYDVVADGPGYTGGVRSPGYLPRGFTVTPAVPGHKVAAPVVVRTLPVHVKKPA